MKMNTCQATLKSTGCPCSKPANYDGQWCGVHRPKSDCSICFETMTRNTHTTTSCGHTFHMHCLQGWTDTANTCPMCRCQICEERPSNRDPVVRRLDFDPIVIETPDQLIRLISLFMDF
jgi:hypothetical protein